MRNSAFLLVAAAALCASAFAQAAAGGPRFATELPFHECDGLICIGVALDGARPRTLMLDTGNINSTLLTDVANELHWALEPARKDGQPVAGIYLGGEHLVALGRVAMKTGFFVFDRALLGAYKPPVDGSIAYPFFKDRILQIDYPRHLLRISNILTTPVAGDTAAAGTLRLVTFGRSGPPVVVGSPFTLDGKRLHAQIDTVYTGTLLVYDAALAPLGLARKGTPQLFRYTDGGVDLLAAPASAIGFGERVIAREPTVYFVGAGTRPVHQPDGLFEATAGNALFAHSVVTLDFHAMTLDVTPAG